DQWLLAIARNAGEPSNARATAISRLSRSNISTAELNKLFDGADSRGMRDQLIRALQVRKDSAATDKLIDIAKNSTDVAMRTEAIRALANRNDPRATKALLDL